MPTFKARTLPSCVCIHSSQPPTPSANVSTSCPHITTTDIMVQFLDLPREVRDMIYGQYVFVDGGYVHDFNSNTLKGADNTPIDLAFMLTCKKVAMEMKGLALSSNSIYFSTVYSEDHRGTAGRFGLLIKELSDARGRLVNRIHPDILSVPHDMLERLKEAYPRFAPYLDLLPDRRRLRRHMEGWLETDVGPPGCCGETPSAFRQFQRAVLQDIADNRHRFDAEQLEDFEDGLFKLEIEAMCLPYIEIGRVLDVDPNPWDIPTAYGVEVMISSAGSEVEEQVAREWDHLDQNYGSCDQFIKYRYSAAAVAIRFLAFLSKESRLSLRNIILNEDRVAVGFAESHGLGLIPYCRENLRLRIKRQVSMWRTVFLTTTTNYWGRCHGYPWEDGLRANEISYAVATWIAEALELGPAGMPPGSFTLSLEGDGACSTIFKTVIQRDAAWQTAIDCCLERNLLPRLSWGKRRRDCRNKSYGEEGETWHTRNMWYVLEAFPQAIRDMTTGDSIVTSNFDLGESWDVERLVEENKGWTMQDWKVAWHRNSDFFQPDPPLPRWDRLVHEHVASERSSVVSDSSAD
ncbi:hypothetical protein LX32DRAFT_637549 [Colletotrichum zoysiae]|uniref:Uncharacterized protein n=1 Tax=Colletotrichum zoysiae TaxID=1216348 RepID=A0AAD9HN15_9PEZI|nr:hypothetical protein LX32DRAFT_637549 [Colletotrichum zoysiae]